jgi:hypothetical protein
MRDNTAFNWSPGLIRRTEPKKSKIFQLLLSGQQRRRIKRNKTFLLMAHARIFGFFQSRPIRYLFSGVEIGLNGSYWIDLIAYK